PLGSSAPLPCPKEQARTCAAARGRREVSGDILSSVSVQRRRKHVSSVVRKTIAAAASRPHHWRLAWPRVGDGETLRASRSAADSHGARRFGARSRCKRV